MTKTGREQIQTAVTCLATPQAKTRQTHQTLCEFQDLRKTGIKQQE